MGLLKTIAGVYICMILGGAAYLLVRHDDLRRTVEGGRFGINNNLVERAEGAYNSGRTLLNSTNLDAEVEIIK